MSFDIFLSCVDRGESSHFPVVLAEQAFLAFVRLREPTRWVLADCRADIWIKDLAEISDFGVSRPPGDPAHPFWQGLLTLMQKTQTFLYWPTTGYPRATVAQPSVIPHISADMREVLGTVPIVTRPEQFWEYIEQSNA